ncbi:MAG: polyphosphate polymerase domain-containing protein [Oscillospiraceae bacterium]|nr:polyphosphate polymerase domain-containing protein [Oscillospiraceae bacterium]
MAVLASKLKTVMKPDLNQQGTAYTIRSLYFDDIWDSCMEENEFGIDDRRKLRIRTYTYDSPKLYLENKKKHQGYTKKIRNIISRQECIDIMNSITLPFGDRQVVNLLSILIKTEHLQPKVIIEYERSAFVHPLGNVRITFDRNISASRCCEDFLSQNVRQKTAVLPKGIHVLEIKYDEFLPDIIAQLVEDGSLSQTAFSKYYLGRLAVNGEFVY